MNPLKILLVEDETSIADNVRVALESEGMRVHHQKTAQEGYQAFESGRYDLLILDVGLPDESGFELCKKIRARSASAPVIFLTARSDEVDKIVGFEIGADDYLTKPFSPRELLARIKAVSKRLHPRSPQTPTQKLGSLEIDHEKFRVRLDGVTLELSRYEFKLLHTLLNRPGVVFSRSQLMQAVWDDPDMSLERTIDTHIKSIRAKLRAVRPDLNLIETHRGLGYSIKDE